jgi:hypothetical protein
MCYQSKMTPRLKTGGGTIGCSPDIDAEKVPQDSMYSKELRSLIAECLLVTPASRIPAAELADRTTRNLNTLRMSMGMAFGPFQEFEEPQLSQRWYSGQLNGDPANAAPVPVLNPLAQPFNPFGKAKLNAGAQDFVPVNQPQVAPQVVVALDPSPISSGVIVNISPVADMPGPNPAAADALYPIPDPLIVIVLHRAGLFGYGARNHATYRLMGLKSASTVKDVIEALVYRGVKEPFTLTYGRQAMTEAMKLGEFKNLQNIRATEI